MDEPFMLDGAYKNGWMCQTCRAFYIERHYLPMVRKILWDREPYEA
jgi:hypothetical protein